MLETFRVRTAGRLLCFIELESSDSARRTAIGNALEAMGWVVHGTHSYKHADGPDVGKLVERTAKKLDGLLVNDDCLSFVHAADGVLCNWVIAPPRRETHARFSVG